MEVCKMEDKKLELRVEKEETTPLAVMLKPSDLSRGPSDYLHMSLYADTSDLVRKDFTEWWYGKRQDEGLSRKFNEYLSRTN